MKWLLTVFVSFGVFAAACIDTSPVHVFKEGGVIGTWDATEDDDAGPNPACRACIAAPNDPGPGCGDELGRCGETKFCMRIYECAYAGGCVFKKTQNESIACALPCASDITDVYDPSISRAVELTSCFHANCVDVCAADLAR
jgi:hypothetical protein